MKRFIPGDVVRTQCGNIWTIMGYTCSGYTMAEGIVHLNDAVCVLLAPFATKLDLVRAIN